MQSAVVIITKLIASGSYVCKEFFVIILAAVVVLSTHENQALRSSDPGNQ